MRAIKAAGALVAASLAAGCHKPQLDGIVADAAREMEAAMQEGYRQEFAKQFGPTVLGSLVGAAAPPGGPLCLLGRDAGWQQWADAAAADRDADGPPPEGPPFGLRMFFKAPPRKSNP